MKGDASLANEPITYLALQNTFLEGRSFAKKGLRFWSFKVTCFPSVPSIVKLPVIWKRAGGRSQEEDKNTPHILMAFSPRLHKAWLQIFFSEKQLPETEALSSSKPPAI